MNVALAFAKRAVVEQGLLTAASFVVASVFAPVLLQLDEFLIAPVVARTLALGVACAVLVAALSWLVLRRARFVLRAVALGSSAIEPSDIATLARLPRDLVGLQVGLASLTMLLLGSTSVRPTALGGEVGHELAALGLMVVLATAVPAFVLSQSRLGRVLEVAALAPVTSYLEELIEQGRPRRIGRFNLIFAVVVPVGLVGVGGALASFSQLRAITDKSRTNTALALGRGVVGSGEGRKNPGREAAAHAALRSGYDVTLSEEQLSSERTRTPDDRLSLTVPLRVGSASVVFDSELGWSRSFPFVAVAAVFALLSGALATALAALISRDLSRAAGRLNSLGTEAVLSGGAAESDAEAGAAGGTFRPVSELLRAALGVADSFRVFAAAQERALEARENAQRARGLLFASVSHDLKSPLNAIVGFADSIDPEELSAQQRESLHLIATRGRELVALIETILDAARVEAGQLRLERQRATVTTLLTQTAKLGRELGQDEAELRLEIAEALPEPEVDPVYLPRALAVIAAHALRAPTRDGAPARVVLRASLPDPSRGLRVEIDHGPTSLTAGELSTLFDRQAPSRARGLTLGLSLARTVIEMHGGQLEVLGGPDDAPVVQITLPLDAARPGASRSAPPRRASAAHSKSLP